MSGQDWVLARSFCAFTVLDGSGVPASRRKAFSHMAAQRWSPFPDGEFHIEWVGTQAMVWAWSSARILELRDGLRAPVPRRVRPESLYRGVTHPSGAALVAMDEGVEGRVWRDHAMTACRWWPEYPDREEWNAFRRGAGMGGVSAMPEVEITPLLALPWTRQRSEALNDLATRHRKILQSLAVALVLALVFAPLVSSIRLLVKTALLERVIDSQTQEVESVLSARESAEADLAQVQALLALRPPARQLQLISTVVSATPGSGWQLLEWRMPDRSSLEVVMRMPNPNPTALVSGWEATRLFTKVSVDLGRTANEVGVKASIVGGKPAPAGETP